MARVRDRATDEARGCVLPGAVARLSARTESVARLASRAVAAKGPSTGAMRKEFERLVARIKAARARHQSKADNLSAPEKARRMLAAKYYNYKFADTKNYKYGLQNPRDIRASWNYIHQARQRALYSPSEVRRIEARIVSAWKKKIDPEGPPEAQKGKSRASGAVATSTHPIALAAANSALPTWVELMPAGKFTGRDGRGPFVLADPHAVIRNTQALQMSAGIPIDFDHATDLAAPRGERAPAAGWIKELAVRDGKVYGRVEWTPSGAEAVRKREYRYISPVFEFDRETGVVKTILRAALTNNPALRMEAICSSEKTLMAKKSKIDALVAEIQEAAEEIGLPVDSLLEGISHKLGGHLEESDADAEDGEDDGELAADGEEMGDEDDLAAAAHPIGEGPTDLEEAAGDDEESEEEMAARHREEIARAADDEEREETAARHRRERIRAARRRALRDERRAGRLSNLEREKRRRGDKHPREDAEEEMRSARMSRIVCALQERVNQLQAERARERAMAVVQQAMRAGKLMPALREWALGYALRDPDGFDEFLARQPVVVASNRDGTFVGAPSSRAPALSPTERAICANLGIPEDRYIAHRAARDNGSAPVLGLLTSEAEK